MARGHYDHLTFPPYKFQEYPKWITNKAGQRVLVQNASEEMGTLTAAEVEAKIDPIVAERDELAKQNAELMARLAKLEGQSAEPTPEVEKKSVQGLASLTSKKV